MKPTETVKRMWQPTLGARLTDNTDNHPCQFRLWAPNADTVYLHLLGKPERLLLMQRTDGGYHQLTVDNV